MTFRALSAALPVAILLASGAGATVVGKRSDALHLPLSTSGSKIVDARGESVIYAGTNWPGHLELMLPEGLQHRSISDIVAKIRDFGLNSVRLTYATQMVDEIYENGHDTSLEDTVVNPLGASDGAKVLRQILFHNPQFTADTTRLQVFDAVAQELARQDIILHLDNHVSNATWCCLPGDGNGWFGEGAFNVESWKRGWTYMARHASIHWPSFASVGLRNELRSPLFNSAEPYDWYTWFVHMNDTATAINQASPDTLLFFGGRESDTAMGLIPRGQPLGGSLLTPTQGKVAHFIPDDFVYKDKIVLEVHKYDLFSYKGPCFLFEWDLRYNGGFQGIDATDPTTKYVFPMVLTEFGFSQDGTAYLDPYAQCLTDFVSKERIGFMHWDLAGSYYLRQGRKDPDEGFGLLTHDWSRIRSPVTVENTIAKMVAATQVRPARTL